jgi:hypothetical protein
MDNPVRTSNPLIWLLDPVRPTRDDAQRAFRYEWSGLGWMVPAGVGLAALVVTLVGWVDSPRQFYFSYLVAWSFCLSLTLGALFFVLIQHLTRARWSVVIRRIPEALAWSFPLLAVLGIPLLFGLGDLYHWTHHELIDPADPAYDPVIAGKAGYLNVPFFLARMAFYFLVWSYLAWRLYTGSLRQDVDGDPAHTVRLRRTSAWGIALTGVTTAFASFDLLMSLDPHWFSTIFGVYFFGGSFLAIMAFMILLAMVYQRGGMLREGVSAEHYQDLGKFMFGFVVFWAYIAFSQYMLIWYGNLPEETVWYRHRLEHGWELHSATLLIFHFAIPFVVLISRWAKRMLGLLAFMSVWLLFMHWFDLHWIVMPVLHEEAGFHLLDFTALLGLGGIWVAVLIFRMSRHSMVPQRDPRLGQSLGFLNS